mmetsp:Transcript_59319/g.129933  ORF Transcript_59319/g.129933 Transcript_59319/m.129933 type:complete len:410 (-) Transcript_59319:21-1250(-)
MASSSSSSSSSDHKKTKKSKKNKKEKRSKKDKKEKKASKSKKSKDVGVSKTDLILSRMPPNFDADEVVRLTSKLLEMCEEVANELEAMFKQLDKGKPVDLASMPDKGLQKKVRHMLQCCCLEKCGSAEFKKPKSVEASLKEVFRVLLADAKSKNEYARLQMLHPSVMVLDAEELQPAAPAVLERDDSAEEEVPEVAEPPKIVRVGPQVPTAEQRAEGQALAQEGEEDDDAGPKPLGEERVGVNWDMLKTFEAKPKRESWMLEAPDDMTAAFGDMPAKQDVFAVRRSPAEEKKAQEQIEAYNKKNDRGQSLLEQTQAGKYQNTSGVQESARKKFKSMNDMWGMSEGQQTAAAAQKAEEASRPLGARRPFDPERDMRSSRGTSKEDFAKFVEQSKGISDRFHSSGKQTSFL